jgi:adenylate cyclase
VLRRIPQRVLLAAAAALVALGIAIPAYAFGVLWPYELKTVDYRFELRGAKPPPRDIVLVAIDDVTLNELNLHWPFPYALHARAIRRIAAARPRAIAYDVQFTEKQSDLQNYLLVSAARRARPIVLATTEVSPTGTTKVFGGKAPKYHIPVGNGSIASDRDGVFRHTEGEIAKLKTFGVVAAETYLRHPLRYPRGRIWIDYAGPPGTIRTVSFSSVVRGQVPPSVLRGKLVVVGSTDSNLGAFPTSAADAQAMGIAEIEANAAETALHGFPLRSAPGYVDVLLIVVCAVLVPLAGTRLRGWWPLAATGAAVVALGAGVQLAFNEGRIVAFSYPLLALVTSSAGTLILQYTVEAVERKTTHDVFSRFVPEAVVDKVLARTDERLRLGGEQVVGTVMFTDLRGFTSFSERLPASEVIDLLNRYLSEMSDAILAHGGTLVSYAGDGIMAVFGAPLAQPDHADRALATAREMLAERLPRYNEWLRGLGFERGFKMGIGLNTGPFMSGNVGSERRLEYTAIGDTINTASRLQDLTKGTPYALLLAESTREALSVDAPALVFVEEAHVRGREGVIRLWTLADPAVLKKDWESERVVA